MNSPQYSTQDILQLLELNNNELDSTQVTNPQETLSDLFTDEVNEVRDDNSSDTKTKKKTSLSKNPYAKFALIALAVGSVAIFLGLLFAQGSSIYSTFSDHSTSGESSPSGLKTTQTPSSPTDTLEQRNAKLSGELALAEQNEQIKAIRDQLDNGQDTPQVTVAQGDTATEAPKPVVKTQVPPTRVVHQPATGQRVHNPSSTQKPSIPRQSQPPSQPLTSAVNSPSLDPIEQWQRLAQLGSYGGGQQVTQAVAAQSSDPELSPVDDILDQTTLVNHSTGRSLQLGQKASASLTTPIAVPTETRNLTSPPNEFIFSVTLKEPLKTHHGENVLDKGATVIFAVQSVQNGLVNSRAVAVIHQGQEYPLPADALQIRLSNGSPLIAQLKDNYGGEIAQRDGVTFLMGALSQAGELANRASSTSTFSGVGGVSSTSTFNQPNYVGAVLEGGFGPLAEQWQQRNQQALDELQNLSRFWWLDAGLPVQVWVTRSVELGGPHAQTP